MKIDISEINRYSQIIGFINEFIPAIEKDNFNFEDFMKIMYGGTEEFKKNNLENFGQELEAICEYLGKYEHIKNVVEEQKCQ